MCKLFKMTLVAVINSNIGPVSHKGPVKVHVGIFGSIVLCENNHHKHQIIHQRNIIDL